MNPKPAAPLESLDYDSDRVDEVILALLYLTSFQEDILPDLKITQSWKSHDWDALNRLYQKGFISNPVGKAKSVTLTNEGSLSSKELFYKLFGK